MEENWLIVEKQLKLDHSDAFICRLGPGPNSYIVLYYYKGNHLGWYIGYLAPEIYSKTKTGLHFLVNRFFMTRRNIKVVSRKKIAFLAQQLKLTLWGWQ